MCLCALINWTVHCFTMNVLCVCRVIVVVHCRYITRMFTVCSALSELPHLEDHVELVLFQEFTRKFQHTLIGLKKLSGRRNKYIIFYIFNINYNLILLLAI